MQISQFGKCKVKLCLHIKTKCIVLFQRKIFEKTDHQYEFWAKDNFINRTTGLFFHKITQLIQHYRHIFFVNALLKQVAGIFVKNFKEFSFRKERW